MAFLLFKAHKKRKLNEDKEDPLVTNMEMTAQPAAVVVVKETVRTSAIIAAPILKDIEILEVTMLNRLWELP